SNVSCISTVSMRDRLPSFSCLGAKPSLVTKITRISLSSDIDLAKPRMLSRALGPWWANVVDHEEHGPLVLCLEPLRQFDELVLIQRQVVLLDIAVEQRLKEKQHWPTGMVPRSGIVVHRFADRQRQI